ncbi:SSI family serine proteinase inhibitor [Nonomuraea sp. NPDC046570]|uniref:SSI family serine proteinase inhibitor n=1 Tax=Nonomuraea sp. NPDC046570 TaxID=3155255 RepID=UPI0033D34BFC
MHVLRSLTATALAVVALTTAAPSQAEDIVTGELRITRYNIHQGTVDRWYLTCDPDGATHPDPKAACDRLWEIGGDLEKLRFRPVGPCPRVYHPIRVEIDGRWYDQRKKFAIVYPNSCFAELLALPVVPTP